MRSLLLAAALAVVLRSSALADPPADKPQKPLRVLVACSKGQLSDFERYLEKNYHVQCLWAGDDPKAAKKAQSKDKPVVGLEKCAECDVMLLNLYRVTPSEEQLKHAQKYFADGKPVVGLRKASHAFQNWLQVDKVVFGAKYGGHYFEDKKNQVMTIEAKGQKSPLIGDFKPFLPGGGLYRYTELAPDVEVLISGGPSGKMMPQVWSRVDAKTKARIFYSRYDPNDLKKDEGCRLMTVRALFWAAGREVAKR